jgi:hypothetical protein
LSITKNFQKRPFRGDGRELDPRCRNIQVGRIGADLCRWHQTLEGTFKSGQLFQAGLCGFCDLGVIRASRGVERCGDLNKSGIHGLVAEAAFHCVRRFRPPAQVL